MSPGRAFDARPDPALGAALRGALASTAQDALVARVLDAIDHGHWWRVLAGWARAGIAACAVTAVLAGTLVPVRRTPGITDVLIAATDSGVTRGETALFVAERPPDPGALFATLLDR